MDEIDVSHLAGVFDAGGTITAHIHKGGAGIGYRFEPRVKLHRPLTDEALLGKLDAFCEEHNVQYNLSEVERDGGDVAVFEVVRPDSIERLLTVLLPYLVSKHEESLLMLEEIVPRVQQDEHLTKSGFLELMEYADRLRMSSRYGPTPKYTHDYFEKEWANEA